MMKTWMVLICFLCLFGAVSLAQTQQASGMPAQARDAWRQALTIMEDLHHPDTEQVRAKLTRPP